MPDTNNITHTLNTEYLERKGLIYSLKEAVALMNNSKKVKCDLLISGFMQRFVSKAELMIFRIAQEAINNSIKHADCSYIIVRLDYGKSVFSMCITDNGKGFNLKPGHYYGKSIGLLNMLERTTILNGNLNIDSQIGKGTNIHLLIGKKALNDLSKDSHSAEDIKI